MTEKKNTFSFILISCKVARAFSTTTTTRTLCACSKKLQLGLGIVLTEIQKNWVWKFCRLYFISEGEELRLGLMNVISKQTPTVHSDPSSILTWHKVQSDLQDSLLLKKREWKGKTFNTQHAIPPQIKKSTHYYMIQSEGGFNQKLKSHVYVIIYTYIYPLSWAEPWIV